jgi:hypothetical protein
MGREIESCRYMLVVTEDFNFKYKSDTRYLNVTTKIVTLIAIFKHFFGQILNGFMLSPSCTLFRERHSETD